MSASRAASSARRSTTRPRPGCRRRSRPPVAPDGGAGGVTSGPVATPGGDEAPRDDARRDDARRDDAPSAPLAAAADRLPRQQVEVVIPVRTLLVLLVFA